MVKADVIQLQNDSYLVAFIYPEDGPRTKYTYSASPSMFDIERRLSFLQKRYIIEKLESWLNQREHARSDFAKVIVNLRYNLDQVSKRPVQEALNYVAFKRADFEVLASTSEKSRTINYYKQTIVKILDFCSVKSDIQEFIYKR